MPLNNSHNTSALANSNFAGAGVSVLGGPSRHGGDSSGSDVWTLGICAQARGVPAPSGTWHIPSRGLSPHSWHPWLAQRDNPTG